MTLERSAFEEMVHGGYGKRRVPLRKQHTNRRSRSSAIEKPKSVSIKNQIRSIQRLLRKDISPEIRAAQENKLEGLEKQQEIHFRLALQRKIFLRDRKIKFFERRKIERRIRRLEKLQRTSLVQSQDDNVVEQLSKLREDLEYVRFFPKTEKYVSLFNGGDSSEIVEKRNRLRGVIKANLVSAAASGKDLEETGSEDDGLMDLSEDDFFARESSSDEDADDEWTDKSTRDQASSASGKATSGMSSDERNQVFARTLMHPPHVPHNSTFKRNAQSRFGPARVASQSRAGRTPSVGTPGRQNYVPGHGFGVGGHSYAPTGQSSNLSSNSEAQKRRRKRRPRKKHAQEGE